MMSDVMVILGITVEVLSIPILLYDVLSSNFLSSQVQSTVSLVMAAIQVETACTPQRPRHTEIVSKYCHIVNYCL